VRESNNNGLDKSEGNGIQSFIRQELSRLVRSLTIDTSQKGVLVK